MPHTVNLENKNILVVEDDDVNFLYLNQIFKISKGNIFRAKTGKEAIDFCKDHNNVDIILMDIQLPDINGYKTTEEIRKFNKTIPIIAQTAAKSQDESEKAFMAGCTDILNKPFIMNDLLQILNRYLM